MFTLNKKLETDVEINGIIYPINMAFNNVIDFLEILENKTLPEIEKITLGINQLLGLIPVIEIKDLIKVFESLVINFIQDSEKEISLDLEGNPVPPKTVKPITDLKHDAPFIFASFKQAYGIDLVAEQGKLDWRLFKIYLRELPDDTRIKQIIQIRNEKLPTGKNMASERERLMKLKKIYALPE